MKKALHEHAKDVYGEMSLSTEQLDTLQNLAASKRPEPNGIERRSFAIFAALAAAVVLTIFLYEAPVTFQSIAREVAANHIKSKVPKLQVDTYAKLRESLTDLGFLLNAPKASLLAGAQLVGGKYCSVATEKAAQIRLDGPDGSPWTLYQSKVPEKLGTLSGVTTLIESGVEVSIWEEHDVLMVLARPPAS